MIDNEGWISLHRRTLKNPLLKKNPDNFYLWAYLLLKANHAPNEVLVGFKTIPIKRGQFLTGRKKISEQTGIQESKVERVLKLFEKHSMIEQQKTTKYRLISILNYDSYQSSEQQMNNKRTTNEQQVNTNNNVNNENKINKKYKYSPDDLKAAEYIWSSVQLLNPSQKEPNMDSWSNDVRLMVEIDKRTHKEICEVFKWASKDSFWCTNILSPGKLRKQFDTLKTKANNQTTNKLLEVPGTGDLVEFAKKHNLSLPGPRATERDFRIALQTEIKQKQIRG